MLRVSLRVVIFSAIAILTGATAGASFFQNEETSAGMVCSSAEIRIYADYPASRADECSVKGNTIRVKLKPEAKEVNPSPWYSFRIETSQPQRVKVVLDYGSYRHRFVPKVSGDGETWFALDAKGVAEQKKKKTAKFYVEMLKTSLYFSAQEIINAEDHRQWTENFAAANDNLTLSVVGKSVEGEDILKLEHRPAPEQAKGAVFFIGRQHPPEVTGAIAFQSFMEEIFSDSETAQQFREHYAIAAVPLVNPDGVDDGNWRLNTGKIDLNRDWGPFTQPETQAMRDELAHLDEDYGVALFLDFHSTFKNVLYTQTDDVETRPRDFAVRWHEAITARHPDFGLEREGGHNTDRPTSKAYVYGTYGAAAITYEMYDEAARDDIRAVARTAAQEMMKILLHDEVTQ